MSQFRRMQELKRHRNRGGITLHPQHGLNPTLGICFFCEEEDGTIGLLGANGGKEAPRYSIISTEPCKKCLEGMSKGITFIEANTSEVRPNPGVQVDDNLWLTGRMVVVTEDWCNRSLDLQMLGEVLKHRRAYISPEMFKLFLQPQELSS